MPTLLAIPAFNEGTRLDSFLPDLCEKLQASAEPVTLLVVDDGSSPAESTAMRATIDRLRPLHAFLQPMLVLEKNSGKGAAIYAAWDTATDHEWLAFVDADGAVTATDIVHFIHTARTSPDLDGLLANRILMLGRPVERRFRRHLAGRIYATLSSNLTGIPVYDSQCGLKLIRRHCYLQIRHDLETLRFGFDMELIALLHRAGCRLREEPLTSWRDVPGGKVHLLRDSLEMLLSLLALRKKLRRLS